VARSARSRPVRTLVVLLGLIAVLYGVILAGVLWDKAQWTPKLALDLEGGTEIVLSAQPIAGQQKAVDPSAVDESVNIIRQRVNGSGISEAEVTRQGEGADTKIIVSLPGKPDKATRDLVERSAQLAFRAVLVAEQTGVQAQPTPTPSGAPSPGASGKASPSPSASTKPSASARPSPSASSNGMAVPGALKQAPSPSPTGSAAASPKGSASGSPSPAVSPSAKPTDASDLNWVNQKLYDQFTALDCTNPKTIQDLRAQSPDPKQPFVTCSDDGTEKYILGPSELSGTDVTGASASLETNSQGFSGTAYQVNLTFSGEGTKRFGDVTSRLVNLTGTQNRFAIVLDNLAISAPTTQAAIRTGSAQITGNFTQESATNLANQLKYGALPVSFKVETSREISATLGTDNLQRGLLAGVIGLALVVAYSLVQYRALGLVTVASLVIASIITYGFVVLLGWRQGYRLSLPGVAGLIVAIGITADSFIVFFERVRDEVREGRPLQSAVESAWLRARRTILASDAVSFLAAVVLYVLAIGNVRGFAFTLGLTTLIDVLVVFMFTKPMVTLLARTKFFGGGHPLSGFDAEHLGRSVAYAGRGRVRTGTAPQPVAARRGATIAERRAERERAGAVAGEPEPDDPRLEQPTTTSGRES
jgi:preprotein translocase subunit SecD